MIYGYDDIISVYDIKNCEDLAGVSFIYSDRGRIRVNRYLDSISDDKLIVFEDSYGRYPLNYIEDNQVINRDGDSLLINKNLSGYDFVSSNIDISNPLSYNAGHVVNLVYKKSEEKLLGNIKFVFNHLDGRIFEEYNFSDDIGLSISINDDLFTLKSDYNLYLKPDLNTATYSEENQTFTFIYNDHEDSNETVIDDDFLDENENISQENQNDIENISVEKSHVKTPNTSASNDALIHTLILISMLVIIYILVTKKSKLKSY